MAKKLILGKIIQKSVAKWHENTSSMHDFKVRYTHTPAPNLLKIFCTYVRILCSDGKVMGH